jgi:hypothetical protein
MISDRDRGDRAGVVRPIGRIDRASIVVRCPAEEAPVVKPAVRHLVFMLALAVLAAGTQFGIAPGQVRAVPSDADAMAEWIDTARQEESIRGPHAGEAVLQTDTIDVQRSFVFVRDFYATARFEAPFSAIEHDWDFGFGFRHTGRNDQVRLIVDSLGKWYFQTSFGEVTASGDAPQLDTGPNATNVLELVAVGKIGYVALNGEFVTAVDLSEKMVAGDVWAGAGMFEEDSIAGAKSPYSEFEVWSLDERAPGEGPLTGDAAALAAWIAGASDANSVAGPFQGDLQQVAGSASVIPAGVTVADFYVRATFFNPADAADQPWDFALVFRDPGGSDHYRLIVQSSGEWTFAQGAESDVASGTVDELNTGAGESNTIDLVVAGETGYFAVNDRFVATLDTSALVQPGEVWVGTAFYPENTVDGAVMPFRDFQVWSFD